MSKAASKKKVSFTKETKPETVEQPTTTQHPKKSLLLIPYHYILLLGSIFQYYNILESVSEALLNSLIGLMVMQSMYGIIIIESTKKESKKQHSVGPSSIDYIIISLIIVVCLVLSIPMNIILVLFGAPISPNFNAKNFYLSAHLSLLTMFPILVYNRENIIKANWNSLVKSLNQLSQVNCITLAGLLGCWLGVLPVPLDWDRDWQDWPITLLVGAYLFSFLGSVVGYIYNVFY